MSTPSLVVTVFIACAPKAPMAVRTALQQNRTPGIFARKLLEIWNGGTRMDRLEAMSVIIAVTETGSITAASRRLKSPVATVSRKVAELESRLKAQLFQRTSRRMTLTAAGRSYIDACKRIIEQVDDAEREVSGEYRLPRGAGGDDALGPRAHPPAAACGRVPRGLPGHFVATHADRSHRQYDR